LRQHYPEQFDFVANDLLRKYSDQDKDTNLLGRTYNGTVRALLTNRYQVVDNTQLLDAVLEVLGEIDGAQSLTNAKMLRTQLDPDRLDLRVQLAKPSRPELEDAGLQPGTHTQLSDRR
jgi:hypothetical protein